MSRSRMAASLAALQPMRSDQDVSLRADHDEPTRSRSPQGHPGGDRGFPYAHTRCPAPAADNTAGSPPGAALPGHRRIRADL
ncbi:hypothetical protein RirG_023490 [Rhizophagus irregularis DAOM 197198w]|uniref:Uncharacterized protein n=1 Tax=Rhizophagus irregularis (strain DAOM 197198w) TaxID=1432141 RepID=A0A015K6Q4_RHIIW|nr:hypothetical protein RirG_023490 [Rhizophagus irregularis DAOM 197198w]